MLKICLVWWISVHGNSRVHVLSPHLVFRPDEMISEHIASRYWLYLPAVLSDLESCPAEELSIRLKDWPSHLPSCQISVSRVSGVLKKCWTSKFASWLPHSSGLQPCSAMQWQDRGVHVGQATEAQLDVKLIYFKTFAGWKISWHLKYPNSCLTCTDRVSRNKWHLEVFKRYSSYSRIHQNKNKRAV